MQTILTQKSCLCKWAFILCFNFLYSADFLSFNLKLYYILFNVKCYFAHFPDPDVQMPTE